jgi:hypothetical protein
LTTVLLATDWVTISALATAGGTLVLAIATFASVRSANRAARVAEQSMLIGLRPLLLPAKAGDPPQKVEFVDDQWFSVESGEGLAEVGESAVYLAVPVRNVGSGIAVLHGWSFLAAERLGSHLPEPRDPSEFIRLTRDLYVAGGDVGFWQGAFRDPASAQFAEARDAIERRLALLVDVLYGDHEGGQRTITRFALRPVRERWLVTAAFHRNLDRADPR